MQANSPKVQQGKRYSEYNEEKIKNNNAGESSSVTSMNTSKIKQNMEEQSFVFSLNSFEKTQKIMKSTSLIDTSMD